MEETKSAPIQIKHRWTGAVLYEGLSGMSIRDALEVADLSGANLRGADLRGANLSGADLHGANLRDADLHGADLHGADLHGADLHGADLHGANLHGADLHGADLHGANLRGADLRGANLSGADLHGANLSDADLSGANLRDADLHGADLHGADLHGANLSGANLRGADLRGANLSGANLHGAKNADLAIARTRILGEGSLIGWKKCAGGVIVKMRIPEEAKRSHAFGRKCRAEYVDVLEVFGVGPAISAHDRKTVYEIGQRVTPDSFCEKWQDECSNGIHFFLSRIEAENY